MHYTRFDRLDWRARLRMDTVRLVIPLAVVDELDGKKYARRDEFQQRARELLYDDRPIRDVGSAGRLRRAR